MSTERAVVVGRLLIYKLCVPSNHGAQNQAWAYDLAAFTVMKPTCFVLMVISDTLSEVASL
jgi:hypothetical protein